MSTPEGGNRAEYLSADKSSKKKASDDDGGRFWIYWRRPDEWSAVLEEWVERTGQKEFWNMDTELLMRSLAVSVKRGKAQIFGGEGSEGVKFF
jgi:ESCRT-II complex subunit VPS25